MSFFRSLFGKKFQDESLDEQRKEMKDERIALEKATGLSMSEYKPKDGCDQISGATGEFGRDIMNPIPVNGIRGEVKYLNRLRCKCGKGLIFHRLESKESENNENRIDIYETVCATGKHWDTLCLDMYYSRRSTFLPKGYHFSDFHPLFSKIPLGFGVNEKCNNFPFGVPEVLARKIGGTLGEKFAAKLEKIVSDRQKFIRQ